MGSAIKKLRKALPKPEMGKASPTITNEKMMELLQKAWSQGFERGAADQRAQDIESTVTLLEGLENIPGIGAKTAWKIQEHVMKQFGGES